jgi:hypothetical protein
MRSTTRSAYVAALLLIPCVAPLTAFGCSRSRDEPRDPVGPTDDGGVPKVFEKQAIVVTAHDAPDAFERALVARLEKLGHRPIALPRADPAALPGSATLVVLAPSVASKVVERYRDLALPVIAISTAHAKLLNLAVGGKTPQSEISRVDVGLPEEPPCASEACVTDGVAATAFATRPSELGALGKGIASRSEPCSEGLPRWTSPSPEAIRLLVEEGRGDHALAYAYEARSAMAYGAIAAARRFAMPSCEGGKPSDVAWTTFDVAAEWTTHKGSTAKGSVRGAPVLASNVVVLDDVAKVVVFRERLEIAYATAPTAGLATGTVVVGGAMGGYARHVERVISIDATHVVAETTAADATEIFEELDLSIGGEADGRPDENGELGTSSAALDAPVSIDFGGGQFELGPYCEAGFNASVTVNRSIGLNARPIGDLSIKRGKIERAKLALQTTGQASVSFETTGAFSASCVAQLKGLPEARWTTTTPVPIGPIVIPVAIHHEVRPIVELEAAATLSAGKVTSSVSARIGLTAGVGLRAGKWSPIFEPTASSDAKVEVTDVGALSLEGKARIGFEYIARLYGMTGPRVRGTADLTGRFAAQPQDCKWTASGDVALDLSIDFVGPGPDCENDQTIDRDFDRRFLTFSKYDGVGPIDEHRRGIARKWYRKARCEKGSIALGRFDEFERTGLAYLNVVPGSDWSMQANLAWLYGAIDRGGTFTMATDPRSPRAKWGNKKPTDGGGSCNRQTITATEVAVLEAEGYRYVFKTPVPTPEGPCGCLGVISQPREESDWCSFGPVATLPVAVPRRFSLASLASLTVNLYRSPPVSREGSLPLSDCGSDAGADAPADGDSGPDAPGGVDSATVTIPARACRDDGTTSIPWAAPRVGLIAGRYRMTSVTGGVSYYSCDCCGYLFAAKAFVQKTEADADLVTTPPTPVCSLEAAAASVAGRSVTFEVPAGGSDVIFFYGDSSCRDNHGPGMTVRVERIGD